MIMMLMMMFCRMLRVDVQPTSTARDAHKLKVPQAHDGNVITGDHLASRVSWSNKNGLKS